jgi:hypothetical protein
MRNTDVAPRKYTSLAWAAVLGHEETFEFLLGAEHDDHELSKVRFVSSAVHNPFKPSVDRTLKTTPFSCCLPTRSPLLWTLMPHPVPLKIRLAQSYEWHAFIMTATPGHSIGRMYMVKPPCILPQSGETKNWSGYATLRLPFLRTICSHSWPDAMRP